MAKQKEVATLPYVRFLGAFDQRDPDNPVPLAFIAGVPTRDLRAEEWAALDDGIRALCLSTKLYELTGTAPEEGSGDGGQR